MQGAGSVKPEKISTAAGAAVEGWVGHDEAAAHIGSKPAWLYENAEKLGIPRVRIGNQFRYKISAVDRWMAGNADDEQVAA